MRRIFAMLAALLLSLFADPHAAAIELAEPSDYQVFQRTSLAAGAIRLNGSLAGLDANGAIWEARIVAKGQPGPWQRVAMSVSQGRFKGSMPAPAGGWHRLDVRVSRNGQVAAETTVAHLGVGEVFVVAGQSNSANFGEERQSPKSGRVAAFADTRWQLADDPQPGAGGKGGSFMPPLGDALVQRFDVPVGFVACGIGATSVREWLPQGTTFPDPPTLLGRVEKLPDGRWASKGAAFDQFIARTKPFGPNGFRAVLWHQGESDANQPRPISTLPGKRYREYLEKLIRDSRRELGWDVPWFVAQASYHVPGDEGSDDIRAAQASLWKDAIALQGPDSDALKGKLRERDGKGVHFSGDGLRVHAAKWAEKIVPWLERQQAVPSKAGAASKLLLPAIFADHMILQRDQPVPVWGWADADAEVTVRFGGQTKKAVADSSGKWSLKLDAMKASGESRTMTISSSRGGAERTLADVLVGEVWLCSGQSNMEMSVGFLPWSGGVLNYEEEIRNSANPLIRHYSADKTFNVNQQLGGGTWSIASADTTGDFTAAGYFFAREIQKRLNVPVAVLNASVGATPIEAWISREALLADPVIADLAAKQAEDVKVGEPRRRAQYLADHAAWREKHGRTDRAAAADSPMEAGVAIDTTDWKAVPLPGSCAAIGARNGGIVWLRREIELPAGDLDDLWVTLPRANDVFAAFVNGTKVHVVTVESGHGRLLHAMRPPKGLLKAGKNVVAIRMQSFLRSPGLIGDSRHFRISQSHIGGQDGFPLAGEWRCRIETEHSPLARGAEPEPRQAPGIGVHYHYTSARFDRMIQPLVPFGIRGVLWYQGEHNLPRASEYGKLLKMLIQDWRTRWRAGDFPVAVCQLPGNGQPLSEKPSESSWAQLREAQTAALALPNTNLANLIDVAEDGDLHPRNKQEVGRRLALLALAKTYGEKDLAWTGPVFDSMTVESNRAVLRFLHAEDGLVAKALPPTYKSNLRKPDGEGKPLIKPRPNSELQGFAICGQDRKWVWADAKIEGSTVLVWSDEIRSPVAVRYAWADHPVCNLRNKVGLPAFPFRTDAYPAEPAKKK